MQVSAAVVRARVALRKCVAAVVRVRKNLTLQKSQHKQAPACRFSAHFRAQTLRAPGHSGTSGSRWEDPRHSRHSGHARHFRNIRDIFATFATTFYSSREPRLDILRHSATFRDIRIFSVFLRKSGMSRRVQPRLPRAIKNVANVADPPGVSRNVPQCLGATSRGHRAQEVIAQFLRRIFCGALCSQTPQLAVKTVRRSILVLKTLAATKEKVDFSLTHENSFCIILNPIP